MRHMRISNKVNVVANGMPKEPDEEYWVCSAGGAHYWLLDSLTDSTGHIHGKCSKCGSESNKFHGGYPDSEFPKQEPIKIKVYRELLDN